MIYNIIELLPFSGPKTGIYSIQFHDEVKTITELFFEKYVDIFPTEIDFIFTQLKVIGYETGLRETFFKDREGNLMDGVCALYDKPASILRLYFVKNGRVNIILGGGGMKPKNIRAYQEDPNLKAEAEIMKLLSKDLTKRMIDRDLYFLNNGRNFAGNLIQFNESEL